MFRSAIITILLFTVALAAPAPAPVSRMTFTCSNQCIPIRNFPCPFPCQAKACNYRIRSIKIPGTACRKPAPSPSPTPSTTPTPSVTPSPEPQIESCEFDIINDLQVTCDCTTTTGGEVSSVVDMGSKFSGTNRFSKSCFESCLASYAIPACESKDLSAFEDAGNDNFHRCCSSCDAEVDNGVCIPFEP